MKRLFENVFGLMLYFLPFTLLVIFVGSFALSIWILPIHQWRVYAETPNGPVEYVTKGRFRPSGDGQMVIIYDEKAGEFSVKAYKVEQIR